MNNLHKMDIKETKGDRYLISASEFTKPEATIVLMTPDNFALFQKSVEHGNTSQQIFAEDSYGATPQSPTWSFTIPSSGEWVILLPVSAKCDVSVTTHNVSE